MATTKPPIKEACEKASRELVATRAHEEEFESGMKKENFNPAFITRLTDHIFKVNKLLDEYGHLFLELHEATGDTTY